MPSLATIEKVGRLPLYIMVHGLQGSKELFSDLITESFFSRCTVIAPDLPGFGGSVPLLERPVTVDIYASVIEQLAISRGHRDVVLIGHSLGGMVATKLLRSQILKVRAIVSMEGNLTLADCGSSREIAALPADHFEGLFLSTLKTQLQESDERSAGFRLEALRRADPATLHEAACSIVDESKYGDLFRTFEESVIPRLLLIGEEGSFYSRPMKGNAEVCFVPKAGHFMMHDNYQFVRSQIIAFLEKAIAP